MGDGALTVKTFEIAAGRRFVVLNREDSERLGVNARERVRVRHGHKSVVATLNVSDAIAARGAVAIPRELAEELGVKDGDVVEVSLAPVPESVQALRKRIAGEVLTKDEIASIIRDIVRGELDEVEVAAFALSQLYKPLTMEEVVNLTLSMVETGEVIDFGKPVYDKHSIGGVPGNKVSLLIVPIVAAAGLLIPKTSSKAITSASGTADTMSVLANVEFTAEELMEIVEKVGGAIVWGGALNLAPADDLIIRVEYQLAIDPESQMLASVMAKKVAAGVKNLVVDIPTGRGAKVGTMDEAVALARKFTELGERLGVRVRCGITYGEQPVGHTVGPALEAREALEALGGEGPTSLIEKSTSLAGLLLEMGGVAPPGKGAEVAKEILRSGKALEKMKQIIEAQGGDPNVKPEDIEVGQHSYVIDAPADGYVTRVDNKAITAIARAAGAPSDRGAGVIIYAKRGYKVERGQPLIEIRAERATKLQDAIKVLSQTTPIVVEGMLLRTFPE